jgi:hypothetical protein
MCEDRKPSLQYCDLVPSILRIHNLCYDALDRAIKHFAIPPTHTATPKDPQRSAQCWAMVE